MGPGFKVFPFFFENGEEMKFNLIFWVWCGLGLDILYGTITKMMPKPIEWLMWQFGISLTFALSLWTSIPVPVKVTMHIGEGVEVKEGESAQDLSNRVHRALQELVDEKQGRRHR